MPSLERFTDSAAFAAAATPMLLRREAENCFFLGLLPGLTNPPKPLLLLVREDAGGPLAVATMTPARHMMMSAMPPAAVEALVDHVADQQVPLPGIQGGAGDASRFAELWSRRTGAIATPRMGLGIFQLTRLIPPPALAPGTARDATMDDVDLVAQWVDAFRAEVGDTFAVITSREVAEQRIAAGHLLLWEGAGQRRAMAAAVAPTPNGMRIGLVYTPREFRGRGYASAVVAALTKRLLDEGRRFCFLYTDLANPTSNRIYRRLGYEHVRDDRQILFETASAAAREGR